MNTPSIISTRIQIIAIWIAAAFLGVTPFRSVGQVASGATFTRVTTGPIATDAARSFGCAWGDYDGDGFLDLMVGNGIGDANALYHNEGNGTFTRVTTGPIATTIGDAGGAVWGDYDNDGNLDLSISNWRLPSFLFRNEGSGNFTQVIDDAIGSNSGDSYSAAWGDYDDDGFLDLVVANSQDEFLYRNNGNGTFGRILTGPVVTSGVPSFLPLWSDYDHDGKLDLHVSSEAASSSLVFHNEGAGEFTRVISGPWAGTGENGTDWGDFDNDGDLDLVGRRWQGGSDLDVVIYRNELGGLFSSMTVATFPLATASVLVSLWGDYDNDGWLDIFCGTTRLGTTTQRDLLFRNNGDGTFTRVTEGDIVNTASRGSPAAAWGDYDNDGFLDLFAANGGEAGADVNFLYRNNGNSNRWLHVNCVGVAANRSSIGARVHVQAVIGGVQRTLLREVSSGSGWGGSALRVHFGLGDATKVDLVRVEWPSGTVKEWRNVAANQILTLTEPPALLADRDEFGEFRLNLKGGRGRLYAVDYSTNLIHWTELTDFTATDIITPIVDPGASSVSSRFYRAREVE
jgi:hypothetical protein